MKQTDTIPILNQNSECKVLDEETEPFLSSVQEISVSHKVKTASGSKTVTVDASNYNDQAIKSTSLSDLPKDPPTATLRDAMLESAEVVI